MAVVEGVGIPSQAEAPTHAGGTKPPGRVKFFYSIGQVVESGYLAVNGFIFFYYTAVLGLSGSLVGAALAISLVLDAIADPLIGSWSDSVRSKFGRRLPVMLIGAPLTMVTMGLLFAPPSGLTAVMLFLWLTVTKMTVRAFASMYNIPYFALAGEMSDDYAERARIVAWRLLAGVLATVLINALAYSVFFAGKGGLQQPDNYPAFGWSIAAIVLVGGLICCAGVWRYASRLPQPVHKPEPMGTRFVGEMLEIFRNRSFRILFLSMLLFTSAAGLHAALQNHNYVFVWKLRPESIQFTTYAYLLGILVGIPLTPLLLRRMEKKSVVALGFTMVIVGWMLLPGARALGLISMTGADSLPWLCVTTFGVGIGSGLIFIAYPSMMADAADEHEHIYGARREGLYFSGLGFAGKAAAGVGSLVGGFALDLMNFPKDLGRQVDAAVPEEVLRSLVAGWGPLPAMLCIIGALVFAPYAIDRTRQAEIVTALKAKRSAEGTTGG